MKFTQLLLVVPFVLSGTIASAEDPSPSQEPAPKKTDAPAEPKPAAAPAVTVPVYPNPTCPIMGKPISEALYTEVEEGRIYLCCAPCAKKVRKDPTRAYAAAYPATKPAGNKVCPITGEPVKAGGPTVLIQGISIAVSSETCIQAVRANTQVALAKAMDPLVEDVRNVTCPVTGDAVASNAFCLIDKALVRLSSAACVEEVRKDPAAALAKAKKLVEAAKKPAEGAGGAGAK